MGTTFAIIDGGGRFSQASSPAITPIANWVTDGELTNLTLGNPALTGVSGTANVSDNDGGSDAATITVSSAGTTGTSTLTTSAVTFHDGTNVISGRFKSNAGIAWLRIQTTNLNGSEITAGDVDIWINISTGDVGNTGSLISNVSFTPEGNGWRAFSANWDLSGMVTDFTGNIAISICSADNTSTTTVRNGTDNYSIHDLLLGHI